MYPPSETLPNVETAGILNTESGKLEALPPEELEKKAAAFGLLLIESDGSRGLPLKAWKPGEPAIPTLATATLGVIPLWPLGQPVSETIIHRLSLFLELSGAKEGEALKPEHLLRVITGYKDRPGLFAAARGKRILFFNQIEDNKGLQAARELAAMLPPRFRTGLYAVVAGSVREDKAIPVLLH
jgi:probable selenium-dependent hydroxylase accessory protein YqeC